MQLKPETVSTPANLGSLKTCQAYMNLRGMQWSMPIFVRIQPMEHTTAVRTMGSMGSAGLGTYLRECLGIARAWSNSYGASCVDH